MGLYYSKIRNGILVCGTAANKYDSAAASKYEENYLSYNR